MCFCRLSFLVRGRAQLDSSRSYISAASWCRSCCYTSYWSYVCPLSYGVWCTYMLQAAAEWQTKMWRAVGRPRSFLNPCEIGLFVPGSIYTYLSESFKIFVPHNAQDLLFQMRYGSLICSKKWLSERPNWRGMFWGWKKKQYWTDVKTWVASASLAVTWLFLRVGQAIIPHLKEGIPGYLLIWKSGL